MNYYITYIIHLQARRAWNALRDAAQGRKEGLNKSYALQRFLADYRDLVSWMNDMKVR